MINEEESLDSISVLSPMRQLAFALLIFERMLPSLATFAKQTGFDDSYCLQARDAAWSVLQNGNNCDLYQSLDEACLRNAPDTEDFSHELTSSALNAVLAISDILEFAVDGRPDHIAHVSTLAMDSVYLYLASLEPSVVSSPEREEKIASHPLMRQEQFQETEDIKFLAALADHFDNTTISILRARSASQHPVLPATL